MSGGQLLLLATVCALAAFSALLRRDVLPVDLFTTRERAAAKSEMKTSKLKAHMSRNGSHPHSPHNSRLCQHTPMPLKSHFTGLDPPTNPLKWAQAMEDACAGKLVLLDKVITATGSNPDDIYSDGKKHLALWSHDLADMHLSGHMSMQSKVKEHYKLSGQSYHHTRAPIVHLGHRFKKPNGRLGFTGYSVKYLCEYRVVVIGCMDSNWGYLSTNMMNR